MKRYITEEDIRWPASPQENGQHPLSLVKYKFSLQGGTASFLAERLTLFEVWQNQSPVCIKEEVIGHTFLRENYTASDMANSLWFSEYEIHNCHGID